MNRREFTKHVLGAVVGAAAARNMMTPEPASGTPSPLRSPGERWLGKLWFGTRAEYDALTEYDDATYYYFSE